MHDIDTLQYVLIAYQKREYSQGKQTRYIRGLEL